MQDNTIPQPNDTTNNDRDIYMEIHAIAIRCPSLHFQYYHVKGHQDKDLNWQLTIAKQYNADVITMPSNIFKQAAPVAQPCRPPSLKQPNPTWRLVEKASAVNSSQHCAWQLQHHPTGYIYRRISTRHKLTSTWSSGKYSCPLLTPS